MDRRELLSVVGAAGLAVVGTQAWADMDDDRPKHLQTDKTHDDCMKACGECARACYQASRHCLDKLSDGEGDRKYHARTHFLAEDCAAFCVLSATMIARGSELMAASCAACADACKTCGDACENSPAGPMKDCAAACRECERSCREMVRMMKGSVGSQTPSR
jgi:hypothetical protein